MSVTSSANAVWNGNLANGSGRVSSGSSDHLRDLPVSWAARTEDPAGRTTPEELLAAAHASCFSMALSAELARAGFTAEQLEVGAEVQFDKVEAGWSVVSSHLTVRGRVPGADAEAFEAAAQKAKDGCPISRAIQGNVEMSVDATLDS
jgi:osmotically inducible protein OsmC